MNSECHVVLPDGRNLSYAQFGSADGHPVMYFHGSPSSRLEPLLIGDAAWCRLGLRVICPDRPGMGRSDFQHGRGFPDWPADVVALANALGWEQFSVLGNSGGGPYVAVCAARIPERLSSAVIVSGGWRMDAPEARNHLPWINRLVFVAAKRAPLLLRLLLKSMGGPLGTREKELAKLKKRVPPADYAAFEPPGRLEALSSLMRESLHQGTNGPVWDMRLYVREFGFRRDEIRMPLHLFHGAQDVNAPIAMVRSGLANLPGARLVEYQQEAHLSTLCNHVGEIAQALVAPRAQPTTQADPRG